MRILFLCHRFPFPPNRGGKIRPFQMIRHLSQQHSVVVASLAHTEQELRDGARLKDHCAEVIAEVLPSSVRWRQAVGALATRTPASVAYFSSAPLRARIREAWQKEKFDLVWVHCAFAAQYAAILPSGGVRVLDFGDIDSAKWLDYARHRSFPLSLGYALEARKLRRYEKQMALQFDRCTATTPGESEEYNSFHVPVPCTVIPNGVDARFFQPRAERPADSAVIVFLGRMDYFPNVDAIRDFVASVFPLVRRRVPQAQLRIIGSNPTRAVRALARDPGVAVTGYVPDVRPYLADAAVAIAPLRIARGTQNKILECMASGLPVVCTPQAARGIQAVPGRDFLVADGPEEFGREVVRVLQNARLGAELASSGRRQVEEAHCWSNSMELLDQLLGECCVVVGERVASRE